ncbi:hypothetical protein PG989_014251 [Apiospora arundinis]
MVDLDWESKKPESEKHDTPGMSMSPLGTASTLIAAFSWDEELGNTSGSQGLAFFAYTNSFLRVHKQLQVELRVGEMADNLEGLRYGLFPRPDTDREGGSDDRTEPPERFHVIHMSNIPDYTGGPLSSFLFGAHLLETGLGTGLTATVLKKPPRWDSVNNIWRRYEVAMYPLMPYYKWERVAAPSKSMEFRDLMPQPQLAKWLHAHFLKICLPYKRGRAFDLVDAPLNLTVFIRLLIHVAELGYPAHWLSKLVGELQRLGDDDGQGASERRAQAPGYNQGLAPPKDLGRALEDGTGDTTTSARYVRREVVRVLTTFKWATDARTATFWLRRGDMEEMVREDSLLYVWRTDFWDRQSGGGA